MIDPLTVGWKIAILGAFGLLTYRTLRNPRQELWDATLMFGVLVPVATADWIVAVGGSEPYILDVLPALGLVAHPWAMVRLLDHLQPVPRWIRGGALGGLTVSAALVLAYPASLPQWAIAGIVVYFVALEVYAAVALARGALETQGPTRNRLALASCGTLLVGAAILAAVAASRVMGASLDPAPQGAFALAIACYYVGFATPASLTRYWAQREAHRFLHRTRGAAEAPAERALADLVGTAERLLDPAGVALVLYGDDAETPRIARPPRLAEMALAGGLASSVRDGEGPQIREGGAALPAPDREAADAVGAEAVAAIPVGDRADPQGALLVYTERTPLFVQDSIDTLELLAEQVGVLLENERLVEEREAAERRRLESEKKALEEAEELKSQFLATMSHEIRTPLNSILGMAQILGDADLGPREQERVETIEVSGNHLLDLINDILDLSKIEAGRLELREEPFEVREVVRGVMDVMAEPAADKDLELAYKVDPEVPEVVVGDAGRVRQVLLNLVSNGVKFTDEGEVVVRVRRAEDGPGDEVTLGFEVSDTGTGIPEDEQEDLFRPFLQVDATDTRDHEGTGLGLTICNELVAMMGGTIGLESEVGEGSTFRFTLPTEEAEVEDEGAGDQATEELVGKRVLVVDDNATNREILDHHLRRRGVRVTLEEDPLEALDRIRDGEGFDAVLLDQMMPEMDGHELGHRIRDHDRDVPILLLSSVGRGPVEGSQEVFSQALRKPVDPETLHRALAEALGAATPATEGPGLLDRSLADRYPLDVLVAEDNDVNQKVIGEILQGFGYEPDLASDGKEAVEAVEEGHHDVVLMDLQMPEMDGYEATTRIRRSHGEDVAVLALSAHAGGDAMRQAQQAGVDGYLTKPVEADEIADALAEAADLEAAP